MKREMRSRRVYEYPRGGLYRESNAEQQFLPLGMNAAPAGPPATNNGAGRGRGRGGLSRGGGGGGGGNAGQAAQGSAKTAQPERYSAGYDPIRNPNHLKEKIGKVVYNRELARAGGKITVEWLTAAAKNVTMTQPR